MQNPVAMQVHYSDYRRQVDQIVREDWQIERPARRRVRATVAERFIALARMLNANDQKARTA